MNNFNPRDMPIKCHIIGIMLWPFLDHISAIFAIYTVWLLVLVRNGWPHFGQQLTKLVRYIWFCLSKSVQIFTHWFVVSKGHVNRISNNFDYARPMHGSYQAIFCYIYYIFACSWFLNFQEMGLEYKAGCVQGICKYQD